MKITFLGAAQTVTGSCYLIEAAGQRFTVDCGMHQGNKAISDRNFEIKMYGAESINFVLLTHAHIDHSGLLPRIGAQGFDGPIYCTEPTVDLVSLMLEDSAHIQEMEYQWKKKQNSRRGKAQKLRDEPLYTMEDAKKVVTQLHTIEFNKEFEPAPNIKVTYRYASHILGAAFIDIDITEKGKMTRLTFSGDLGRPGALLLHDPDTLKGTDYLFVESTYGNRNHKGEKETLTELVEAIEYSYQRKGKVIIPTFAVERAQEIIYSLHLLKEQGKIPKDMPIFLDSPLAIRATDIFFKHSDKLKIKKGSKNPFDTKNNKLGMHFTLNTTESQALNLMSGSAIILSASGMCNAGRIKHHLKHNIWRPESSIVFVGYQAEGTLGRRIIEGAKNISLFNEKLKVAARIFTLGGFSAHAGQSQLLDWIKSAAPQKPHVFITHGEIKAQKILAKLIKEKFNLRTSIPNYMEELTLKPGSAPALVKNKAYTPQAEAKITPLLQDISANLAQLQKQLASVSDKSPKEQAELYKRIGTFNQRLSKLLTKL